MKLARNHISRPAGRLAADYPPGRVSPVPFAFFMAGKTGPGRFSSGTTCIPGGDRALGIKRILEQALRLEFGIAVSAYGPLEETAFY